MMCLGWNNRQTCQARPDEQVVQPTQFSYDSAGNLAAGPSCDTNWFYWAAGILVTAALVRSK